MKLKFGKINLMKFQEFNKSEIKEIQLLIVMQLTKVLMICKRIKISKL